MYPVLARRAFAATIRSEQLVGSGTSMAVMIVTVGISLLVQGVTAGRLPASDTA